jgi:hypothetical protein
MAYCTEHLTKRDAQKSLRGIDNANIALIILGQLIVMVVMSSASPLWLVLLFMVALAVIAVQEDCRGKLKDYINNQEI